MIYKFEAIYQIDPILTYAYCANVYRALKNTSTVFVYLKSNINLLPTTSTRMYGVCYEGQLITVITIHKIKIITRVTLVTYINNTSQI